MLEEANSCVICYKIICKACNWEANSKEVLEIQSGKLTNCPICGWSPKNEYIN